MGIQGNITGAEKLLNDAFEIFEEWNYKELSLQSRLNLARIYIVNYKKEAWNEENFRKVFETWLEGISELSPSNILFKDMIVILPVLLVAYTYEEFKEKVGYLLNKIDNLRKEIETIEWELPEDVKFSLVGLDKIRRQEGFPLASISCRTATANLKTKWQKF